MRRRLNVLLVLALLASCLLLVRTAYENRRVYAELDRARAEQRLLDADFKRLDAERQAQATHGRVERVAREKLRMRAATPGSTHYIDDAAVQTARSPSAPPATATTGPGAGIRVAAAAAAVLATASGAAR